ncbi:uncharacterized protein LOC121395802 [Xenopus laevis]|uniref:Uncharacterized protein LOC121395802 n=1 Tax=Xenopus laevis TaxID=8355 RepID=A0A8J1L938_XENLA|nr:uncharacterized protein LOC121395802 [Xenopus laevis]
MDLTYLLLLFYLFISSFHFKMHQYQLIYWILVCSCLIPHVVYGNGMNQMEEPLYNGDSYWDVEASDVLQFICADVLLWLFLVWLYFRNSGELTLSAFFLLLIVKMGGVLLSCWGLISNMLDQGYRSAHSSQVIPPEAEQEATQAFNSLQSLYISNVVVFSLSIVGLHLQSKENRRHLIDIGHTVMLTTASVISAAVCAICSVLSLVSMLVKAPANKNEQPANQTKKAAKKKRKRVITQPEPQPTVCTDSAQEIVEPIKSVQENVEPEDFTHEELVPLNSAIIDVKQEMLLVDDCSEEIGEVGHEDIPRAKPCMRNSCIYNEDLEITVLTTEPTESQETEVVSFPEEKQKKKKRNKITCFFKFIQNLRDTRKKKSGKSKKRQILTNLTSCFQCRSVEPDDP